MDVKLLDIIADPKTGARLTLAEPPGSATVVESGELSAGGNSYSVVDGIPRFVFTEDQGQCQTQESFGFKWQQLSTFDSVASLDNMRRWLVEKYGFTDADDMRHYFSSRKLILDAGCGAAFSSSTWLDEKWPILREKSQAKFVAVDISEAIDVAKSRLGKYPGCEFIQADVLSLPFPDNTFDTVFSEGVLHHTPSTKAAIKSVARVLAVGGEALIYVYRKKGAIREFTDDYIREQISNMSPTEAWEALRPLTKLGQAFAELETQITVPEDIPMLGIKAGQFDVQRLLYYAVGKMYWNSNLTFEECHHINFDWYHPKYAHRQTEEEVRAWCDDANLDIHYLHEEEAGYTVRAYKR